MVVRLKRREKFIEELTNIIVKNEFSRLKYDIDIYLYRDWAGEWRFFEFKNFTGDRCFNDSHLTLWTVKKGTTNDNFFDFIEESGEKIEEEEERRDRMREFYREYLDKYLEKIIFERQLGIFVKWE